MELATMVVAISLAFTSTFITTFDFQSILGFIFVTIVVIWFWWDYVMDRLAFPPKTTHFPLLDILVLILISLIPFAIRQGESYYVSGVIGVLIIIWGLLIRSVIRENEGIIEQKKKREMYAEVWARSAFGVTFLVATVLSYFFSVGTEIFVILVICAIGWTIISRRASKNS